MFTPALSLLRQSYPEAQIDAVVMIKGVKDIFEKNPAFSNVFYFDFIKEGPLKSLLFLSKLRMRNYDISINVYPSNRKEYNLVAFLAGAKKRAAVRYLRMDRQNLGFLNNLGVDEYDFLHNVEENVRLCQQITGKKFEDIPPLDLPVGQDDLEFADAYIQRLGIKRDDLVIGFHPGCSTLKNHINRRWEPEKFSALGRRLIEANNARVLIFGGPEEDELKSQVLKGIGSERVFAVKAPSLSNSAAVMKRCDLFITNDSSLMHVASALRLKVVAVIGPTNVYYIHPWKTDHTIVSLKLDCSPCFFYSPKPLECKRTDVLYKCVREITPEMVYDAAVQYLENGSKKEETSVS